MGNLVSLLSAIPVPDLNWVGTLVQGLYNAIGSYGWTVVLFTLILKVITLPLDFWQRCLTKKNAIKMEQMKPMMAKIDKAYGENKKGAQQEKQKLMKKFGYSMFSSCLPALVTIVFFVFMFTGLTSYTTHANVTEYNNLVDSYHYAIVVSAQEQGVDLGEYAWLIDDGDYEVGDWSTEKETAYQQFFTEKVAPLANSSGPMADTEKYDAIIEGTKPIVGDFAGTNRESFLWIKNIWRPDTWATVMPTYSEFTNGSLAMAGIKGANETEYQIIYEAVGEYAGGYAASAWNGLLILPVLSGVLSFVSTKLSQKTQNATMDPAMQGSGKFIYIFMPLLMVLFVLMYTAALGVYIVCQSIFTIIFTLILTPIVNKIYSKKDISVVKQASYRR